LSGELTFNFMELTAASMLYFGTSRDRTRESSMLQVFTMQRVSSLLSAVLGGYGVFCVLYSYGAPDIAAQALILLGAALVLTYCATRE
jgi:multisubunit Na+/H+ antiporter MnhB subunit